ncbi:MAG: hypothetical protein IPL61_40840 [Myxococcales bacterium]|nr:hypothetical protein [Myxococcales bacterium]
MRILDELTDEELLKAEEAERVNETAAREDEEQDEAVEEAPLAVRRYGSVVRTVTDLMHGRDVDLSTLAALSDDEREAMATLREVISGRRNGQFYFAEDRLNALNETLAVLAPVLTIAALPGAAELHASFDRIRVDLNELRGQLSMLEAAEDQLILGEGRIRDEEEDDDDADGDDADGDDADGAAAAADADADAEPTPKKKRKKKPAAPAPADEDAPDAPAPASTVYDPPGDDGAST